MIASMGFSRWTFTRFSQVGIRHVRTVGTRDHNIKYNIDSRIGPLPKWPLNGIEMNAICMFGDFFLFFLQIYPSVQRYAYGQKYHAKYISQVSELRT